MNEEDVGARLAAWRAEGAHRLDPVRFRLIEAMARRAAEHTGAAREGLDRRLEVLVAAYASRTGQAAVAPPPASVAAPGALAALSAQLAEHAAVDAHAPGSLGGAPELKTLGYFRQTWTRLNADRQLTQSLAKVPENAGPLNSHHLVHRSLLLMRELSPAYLHRFMGYVDTLMWVEQAHTQVTTPSPEAPRAPARKSARAKAR